MEICYICAIPFIQTPINDVVWLCCDMKDIKQMTDGKLER